MTPKPAYDENGRRYYSAASLRDSRQTKARAAAKRAARTEREQEAETRRLTEHLRYVDDLERRHP